MKTKPALLLLVFGFLALPLLAGTALADGDRGWDKGFSSHDRGHYEHRHHHRHDAGHWYARNPIHSCDRWDRGPVLFYREGGRYERPWVERRTLIYGDRWR